MVRKGEYLERAVVIPGSHGTLEGLFHRGHLRPPLLVAPMFPVSGFGGGSMESAIIAELAWAVTRRGHPTLRFNYRGVGASSGTFSNETAALADARDAADHLRNTVGAQPLAIAGVAQGASIAAALALADEEVELLIAVGPDAAHFPEAFRSFAREVVVVVAEGEAGETKSALAAFTKALPNGRFAVIPEADRAFVRGLVELGRVVADAVAPPGMISL
jgi:uncharacterized protein